MNDEDRVILLGMAKVLQGADITTKKAVHLIDYLKKLVLEIEEAGKAKIEKTEKYTGILQ